MVELGMTREVDYDIGKVHTRWEGSWRHLGFHFQNYIHVTTFLGPKEQFSFLRSCILRACHL